MPEHLKALVVILALATAVFVFFKKPACVLATAHTDFERRRNLWFGITLVAFLAHNFWIFLVATATLLILALPKEKNKLALFCLVLFAAPPIESQITGLGVIQHFFNINYIRLLALAVLLPAFISLLQQPDTQPFGRSVPDKMIVGYMALSLILTFTASSFTNTLRHGIFYSFIDIFLPYFVASRSAKTLQSFREILMTFVIAALILSVIAVFEYTRHWLLYTPLENALGTHWSYGNYMSRGSGSLRAQGSAGHPITLGYIFAVAFGLMLYLKIIIPNAKVWWIGITALITGLILTFSRGPWVGAGVTLIIYFALSPTPARGLLKGVLVSVVILPILLATPVGEKIIESLPFMSTVDTDSVVYRQRLFEVAVQVILENPFLGAYDYFYSSAMQELKQGEGIIDVVNTYIGIGLANGLVGLSLFSGFFITLIFGVFKSMRRLSDKNDERYLLGQALIATLTGILVIIATVSSISFIPTVYWLVGGLCGAYIRAMAQELPPAKAPAPNTKASSYSANNRLLSDQK